MTSEELEKIILESIEEKEQGIKGRDEHGSEIFIPYSSIKFSKKFSKYSEAYGTVKMGKFEVFIYKEKSKE